MKETFEKIVDHLLENGFFMEEAVEILERTLIARAVERTDGNRSAASKLLGIHRNTLQRKIAEYKLGEQRPRSKPARREQPSRHRLKTG
ncbi:MAG TPA: helix-turn-helix domain-containing protein [Bryobacteraceae bacterium]|jgi:DNA-binding NtrC family response regulator|nr:helix-turn-helix domain-containing protein [Bryobacteraceae bacterium]